ncbi:MAG: hypothetical protein ACI8Z1_002861 [Candidatus Azotimanducaceae bacterium]|jgi:hypothetical protein
MEMIMNPVVDELAIRHLVAAYADAVNRRDEALWASTWDQQGVWDLRGNEFEGADAIVEMWRGAMQGFSFVVQLVYQGTVEIDGLHATGRWYLAEHLRPAGSDSGLFNIGTYEDSYVKQDGEWLFARRTYHVLYSDEGKGDMSGTAIPLPGTPMPIYP